MKMRRKWTKEACIEEAKKYATRKEWSENSPTSYQKSHDRGWIDECTIHMPLLRRESKFQDTTLEDCKADALKYQTRSEWQEKSPYMKRLASRKGWLDECCSHMSRSYVRRTPSNVVRLFGRVTMVPERDLNTMLAGLQEAKVVLMAATEGCCLVSVNEAIEVIERLKRSKAV